MRKVTDLKENECIHCATKEEFKAILELNPKNDVKKIVWKDYRKRTIYYPCDNNKKGSYSSINHAESYNYTIHTASDFLQPTYQLTKTQIIEISEDGSLVKELFPDCFEEEYSESGWYYATCHGIEDYLCHFENPKTLTAKYWFSPHLEFVSLNAIFHKIQRKGKTEEVETALVNEAKRRGFVKGNVIKECLHGGDFNAKLVKGYLFEYESNQLWINSKTNGYNVCIFDNGTWAEIIQPPNDVIKVIETYGKDKLITLIESYDHNTDIYRAFSK